MDHLLYFSNVSPKHPFWKKIYPEVGKASQFYIDIAKRLGINRFITRNEGEWSAPWSQQIPDQFKMLPYDPNFKKTYEEVTDEQALTIKQGIQQGKKYGVMYSGGMDSTCVAVALIKNLTPEELESVVICASVHSRIENPNFWRNHIHGKFKTLDSNKYLYDDYIGMGYTPIISDEGDCIFGTAIGLQLYYNYDYYVTLQHPAVQNNLIKLKYKISDGNIHYSRYKDILIRYFSYDDTDKGLEFGKLLYEKYHHNILTSKMPVNSLHDFFWWLIFNVKYLNCSIRSAIYYNITMPAKECIDNTVNWFNSPGYQYWSMANNNNGMKIQNTHATYKYAQRKYIYDFDKNDWYFKFKTKLESLGNLNFNHEGRSDTVKRFSGSIIGMNDKYEYLCIEGAHSIENVPYTGVYHYSPEITNFFEESLFNYKLDWLND